MGFSLTDLSSIAPGATEEPTASVRRRVQARNPIGAPTTNRVLSSKYTDSESGFVYYGYRYYSPGMGR